MAVYHSIAFLFVSLNSYRLHREQNPCYPFNIFPNTWNLLLLNTPKMMNLVALCLVLTSLAAAGVFSPTPQSAHNQEGSTIIKEGHRVVVVEFDEDGHQNTKIKISPEIYDEKHLNLDSGAFDNAKEKIKEAASVLPNLGQGLSQEDGAFLQAPRELVCDAYGRCKHKIARAMGKAKDKVSETAHDAIEKQKEIAQEIIAGKKEAAHEVGHMAADAAGKAKETASHAAQSVKENTEESVGKAKDTLQDAANIASTIRGDIGGNVSNNRVFKMIRESVKDTSTFQTLNSLMAIFNLMGFSIAYGLCIWVTFISSYILSRAMPRQQFGVVQSKIYPVYFKAMAYSIGLALLGHSLSHSRRLLTSKPEKLQMLNLLGSLLTVFVNSVYLEPRATKVMFERMKIEKEEGRGREDIASEHGSKGGEHQHPAGQTLSTPTTGTGGGAATAEGGTSPTQDAARSRIIRLNEKLKKLNSYSSFLNILTLMSLTWHLVYLAQRLKLCPSSD